MLYYKLKVPYYTPFWSFNLGFEVLKNIYLRYMYQKLRAPFTEALPFNIHEPLFWLACCFLSDAQPGQPQVTRVMYAGACCGLVMLTSKVNNKIKTPVMMNIALYVWAGLRPRIGDDRRQFNFHYNYCYINAARRFNIS